MIIHNRRPLKNNPSLIWKRKNPGMIMREGTKGIKNNCMEKMLRWFNTHCPVLHHCNPEESSVRDDQHIHLSLLNIDIIMMLLHFETSMKILYSGWVSASWNKGMHRIIQAWDTTNSALPVSHHIGLWIMKPQKHTHNQWEWLQSPNIPTFYA